MPVVVVAAAASAEQASRDCENQDEDTISKTSQLGGVNSALSVTQ